MISAWCHLLIWWEDKMISALDIVSLRCLSGIPVEMLNGQWSLDLGRGRVWGSAVNKEYVKPLNWMRSPKRSV